MTSKLDEIAARADAATEGPWETIQSADEETTTWLEAPYDDVLHHDTRGHGHMRQDFAWMKRADAEFIAHAREDIPKLVAALRTVEALAADWKADYVDGLPADFHTNEYGYIDGRDDAADEVRRTIERALG